MLRRRFWSGLLALAMLGAASAGAEPRFSFHSTPGKLPKDVVPAHYSQRTVQWAREHSGR